MDSQEYYLNQENSQCNHILPKKHDKFLQKDNYLGEFYTEEEKAQARSNLGIDPELELLKHIIDNYIDKNSENARYLLFDKQPISGNYNHILSSDSLYKAFRNYYTVEEIDNKLRELQPFSVDSELSGQSENPVQNKVLKEAFDSLYEGVMHQLNTKLNNYYTKEQLENTIQEATENIIEQIPSEVSQSIINITWQELKDLRDNGQLIPGQQYRIIDYVTTVRNDGKYEEARSAGHQFDVIVTADSGNVLNENARAALHENDTYFANSNLSGWKLKYCIDNDTNRFEWADIENGKGVIYEMEDEFNNVLFYDFKNIQYKIYKVSDQWQREKLDGKYVGINSYKIYSSQRDLASSPIGRTLILNENDYIWCYTFSTDYNGGEQIDSSLGFNGTIMYNTIENPSRALSFSVIFNQGKGIYYNNVFFCGTVISGHFLFNKMSTWRSILIVEGGDGIRGNNIEEIVNFCAISNNFFGNNIIAIYNCDLLEGNFRLNNMKSLIGCIIKRNFNFNNIRSIAYSVLGTDFYRNSGDIVVFCSFSNHVGRCQFLGNIYFLKIEKDYFSGNIIENAQYLTITSNQTTSTNAFLQGIKVCSFCNYSEVPNAKTQVQLDNPNINEYELSALRFSQENFPPKGAQEETLRKTISHDSVLDTSLTEYKSIESRTVLI